MRFEPILTLAAWRWRNNWFMLTMASIGMTVMVIVACTSFLFSQMMMTAGLRGALRAAPYNDEIQFLGAGPLPSTDGLNDLYAKVDSLYQDNLRPYLAGSAQTVVETHNDMPFLSPANPNGVVWFTSVYARTFAQHVTIDNGRLPQVCRNMQSCELEVALSAQSAEQLGVKVGSMVASSLYFLDRSHLDPQTNFPLVVPVSINLRVVGILHVNAADTFWHGENFAPVLRGHSPTGYPFLLPLESLTGIFDAMKYYKGDLTLKEPPLVEFTYSIDDTRVFFDQVNDLSARILELQNDVNGAFGLGLPDGGLNPEHIFYLLSSPLLKGSGQIDLLGTFSSREAVVQIPLTILSFQILALLLIFVSMIAAFLVERQSDAITLLSSRGASRWQVVSALGWQCLLAGGLALVIGPLLSLATTSLLATRLLPANVQDVLNILQLRPPLAQRDFWVYAALALFVSLVTSLIAILQATGSNILTTRREAARATHRPFWSRYYLDLLAALVSLVGYAVALYVSGQGNLLGISASTLLAAPLALVTPLFLVITILLLSLRGLPLIFRLSEFLVLRGRNAPLMLALVYLARSPRQVLRTILLLGLGTCFALFSLVFFATQSPRATEVANYQVGADLSGDLAQQRLLTLQDALSAYKLPGVTAVTAGHSSVARVGELQNGGTFIALDAIDSATFARATISLPDSSQTLPPLLQQLVAQRTRAAQQNLLPIIIDRPLSDLFHLQIGSPLNVSDEYGNGTTLHLVVIGIVEHLPAITRGALLDFQSYDGYIARNTLSGSAYVNHIWMRTSDDPMALGRLRTALSSLDLQLANLQDRRALISSLVADPLALSIQGMLLIGAITTLLLALLGSLLTAWMSARPRLLNFAVLRALGSDARQVARVLIWEQTIIYAVTILLGLVLGVLLIRSSIPTLVFSSIPLTNTATYIQSTDAFYTLQHTLPVHLIVPSSIWLALGTFIIISAVVLWFMVRAVLRPAMSYALRLNED